MTTSPTTDRGGFTLVEVLLVVSILAGLAAIVLVGGQGLIGRTKVKATESLLERLILHVEEYRAITGTYPPDGIDSEVRTPEGTRVRSSAALYTVLTSPIEATVMTGGIPRVVKHDPIAQFGNAELSAPDEDYPGAREILDPFGTPMHYDNTLNRNFSPQNGDVHIPPVPEDEHPLDPRILELSEGGVERVNQVQTPSYDIWSFGARAWELEIDDPKPPIANWNFRKDK